MALNKKCMVCGKAYKYCNTCPSDLNSPSWKMLFDKENCKNIYNILSARTANKLTDQEAVNQLNQCNLSEKDNYNEKIIAYINRLLDSVKEEKIVESEKNIETATEDNTFTDDNVNINDNIINETFIENVEVVNNIVDENEDKIEEKKATRRNTYKMRYSSKESNK